MSPSLNSDIPQVDGLCDTPSKSSVISDNYSQHVRVNVRKRPNNIGIKRNNKVLQSRGIPSISVSNVRSLKPRINSYMNDLSESGISVGLISELWEKEGDSEFELSLERVFEMKGLKYISTPRRNLKRGGGAGIVVDTRAFKFDKVEIHIPYNLEIVWGLLRPKRDAEIKVIIVASFYLPPKSKKKTKLFDHICITVNQLLCKYPKAGILIGGD